MYVLEIDEITYRFSSEEELEQKVLEDDLYGLVYVYDPEDYSYWEEQPDSIDVDVLEEINRYRIWVDPNTNEITYG